MSYMAQYHKNVASLYKIMWNVARGSKKLPTPDLSKNKSHQKVFFFTSSIHSPFLQVNFPSGHLVGSASGGKTPHESTWVIKKSSKAT
jgi:hypothetical protein